MIGNIKYHRKLVGTEYVETPEYFIDGRKVSEREFKKHFGDKKIGDGPISTGNWNKPVLSEAMAVHPSQIAETVERNRQMGINTDYTPDGRPILKSSKEKLALMRLEGLHENNGGYSSGGPRR